TADGDITVSGELQHPESLVMESNFTRLLLTYGGVQVENSGPIRLTSTRDSLKIVSASLKGTDTNVELNGSIQFTGRQALAMKMDGTVDLRLLSASIPDFDVAGHADINASFEGTVDQPRIIGRVKLTNASARTADFPTGLSSVQGDLVFDANRLFFENVTGEPGGAFPSLPATVIYWGRPLRSNTSAKPDGTRIRYREGISWLAGG